MKIYNLPELTRKRIKWDIKETFTDILSSRKSCH